MFKFSPRFYFFFFFTLLLIHACRTDPKTTPAETEVTTVSSRLRAEPDKLNGILTTRGHSIRVVNQIYPTLIEFDPNTLKLSPMLVKSLPKVDTVTEGPYAGYTSFTYEFLEEAKWDNGEPLLGSDYVFTIKTMKNPYVAAPAYRGLIQFIKGVEVDPENPRRFSIYSDETYMRSVYTTGGIYLYPEYFYDPSGLLNGVTIESLNDTEAKREEATEAKLKAFADRFNSDGLARDSLTSCGAYYLYEWVPNERVVLRKKENWWGDALADKYPLLTANPKEIIFNVIPETAAAVNLMKNEEIDCVPYLEDDVFKELQSNELVTQNYNLVKIPTSNIQYTAMNMRTDKLGDKRVRKAIAHLMDVDELINTIKLGNATPIASPIPPSYDYYNKNLDPIKLNIEKAKALLEEAGWKDSDGNGIVDKMIKGKKVELSLSCMAIASNKVSRAIPLILQENARKAGIEIKIDALEPRPFVQRRTKRDFDLFSAASAPDLDYYDPYQLWHTDSDVPSGANFYGFGNAESDQLIEELRNTSDLQKRKALYLKFQEIVYDEQPAIFLYNAIMCAAIHKRLGDPKTSLKKPGIHENLY